MRDPRLYTALELSVLADERVTVGLLAECAGLSLPRFSHLFSRTRDFAGEFASALAAADAIYLADIYAAREQPIDGVTSGLIVDHLKSSGRKPDWTGSRNDLAEALTGSLRSGDVVLTIGAGDITLTAAELKERLK